MQQDGRPRLYVHERCVNLRREIGMYRWREDSKEEPVKEHDHAMDAMRYMVMAADSDPGRPTAEKRTGRNYREMNW